MTLPSIFESISSTSDITRSLLKCVLLNSLHHFSSLSMSSRKLQAAFLPPIYLKRFSKPVIIKTNHFIGIATGFVLLIGFGIRFFWFCLHPSIFFVMDSKSAYIMNGAGNCLSCFSIFNVEPFSGIFIACTPLIEIQFSLWLISTAGCRDTQIPPPKMIFK